MDYSELKRQLNRGNTEDFHNTIVVFTTTPLNSTAVSIINVEIGKWIHKPDFPGVYVKQRKCQGVYQ